MSSTAGRIVKVGARVTQKFHISPESVKAFGDVIGDHNPIHSSPAAAKAAGFPAPICYGMFPGSLFSGLMATELPGPGTVYLSQTLSFTAPMFIGDDLEVSVEMLEFRKDRGLMMMRTQVTRIDPATKKTIVCIDGKATGMNKQITFEGESERLSKHK